MGLEAKVACNSIILSDAQVAFFEKKKQGDEACGEIETAHAGYLGSQETFLGGGSRVLGVFINIPLSIPTAK